MSDTNEELKKLNALVIDDSRVMRNMVMRSLTASELADFEFLEAGSGVEALDQFDADVTEIIFVDWNMLEMNGIEFARQIRSMSWARHIPIIMVTSETGSDKQQDAFDKARITCYITKPFTADEIREKISSIVEEVLSKRESAKPVQAAPAAPPPAKKSGGFFSKLMS